MLQINGKNNPDVGNSLSNAKGFSMNEKIATKEQANSSRIFSERNYKESTNSIVYVSDQVTESEAINGSITNNKNKGEDEPIVLVPKETKATISLHSEKLLLRFTKPGTSNQYSAMFNMKCDIKREEQTVFYLEFQILRCIKDASIGLGMSLRNGYTYSLPGYDNISFGYYSDSGQVVHNSIPFQLSKTYGQGDYIGCGFVLPEGYFYYTHNGKFVDKFFELDIVELCKKQNRDINPQKDGAESTEIVLDEDELIVEEVSDSKISMDGSSKLEYSFFPIVYSNAPAVIEINIGQEPYKFDINSLKLQTPMKFNIPAKNEKIENINDKDPHIANIIAACKESNIAILSSGIADYEGNINELRINGGTLLHFACMNVSDDSSEVVRLLLQYGADPNIFCELYGTPLHTAAKNTNIGAVISLLEIDEVCLEVKWRKKTAINYAYKIEDILKPTTLDQLNKIIELINVLRGAGCFINIHTAAFLGDFQAVKECIEANNEYINAQDEYYMTPLHIAIYRGHDRIVDYLLSKGADPNIDEKLVCPLITAAFYYNIDIINLLARYKVNPNPYYKCRHILELIMEHELEGIDPVENYQKKIETLKAVCKIGSNPYVHFKNIEQEPNLRSPFQIVLKEKDLNMFALLCEYLPNIRRIRGNFYKTILHMIILEQPRKESHRKILFEMAKLLVEKSLIEVNCDITENNNTCLHYAAFMGNIPIIKLLIQHGAHVNDCNRDGLSPLTMAVLCNQPEAAKVLFKNGAKGNIVDSNGQTVLHMLYSDNTKILVEKKSLFENPNYSPLEGQTRMYLAKLCIYNFGIDAYKRDKNNKIARELAIENCLIREYPSQLF